MNYRNRIVSSGVTQKRTWSGQLGMLTLTGIFTALIIIFTAFIGHIPYGVNGGYVHFGDAVIYLAAAILPRPYALIAAIIGGGMSDLMTAPQWMIATILIKPLLVIPFSNRGGISDIESWLLHCRTCDFRKCRWISAGTSRRFAAIRRQCGSIYCNWPGT